MTSVVSFLTGLGDDCRRESSCRRRYDDFSWPYLAICGTLAIGETAGFAFPAVSSAWPVAAFAFVLSVLVGYGWGIPGWRYVSTGMLGLALAMHAESCRMEVFDGCEYSSAPLVCELTVDGRVAVSERVIAFDSSVSGVALRAVIRRQREDGCVCEAPEVGDRWRCSGWLERRPRTERCRRMFWVSGRRSSAARISRASERMPSAALNRLRTRLSENLGVGLTHDPLAADLARAIMLGMRADLPTEVRQMFTDAGTVHVFAISGLHVGVVAWLLAYVMMIACAFPLRWIALPVAPLLGVYVVMIGSPPSAVRAACMSVVYFVSPLFFRRSDSLAAWAITFFSFHVLCPTMLTNVGSLLSFSVMLGILLYLRWATVFPSGGLVTAGVSVAAWLAGVPISASVFERVSIGGLLANVAMIPLASMTVVLGFIGSVTGFVNWWLAAHFNNAAGLMIAAMAGISRAVSAVPYANLTVPRWSPLMGIAWYAAIVMLFWLIRSVYLRHERSI